MKASDEVAIGGTSVRITRLGLGTAPLGGLFSVVPEEQAYATVQRAHALGIRYFDTAPLYGFGMAERRLGHALGDHPRSGVTISTKVGRILKVPGSTSSPSGGAALDDLDESQMRDGEAIFKGVGEERPVWDFSYDGVMRSVEDSLERLGIDRIDLAFIHDPEDHMEAAISESARALQKLRDEGVVGAVGVGMDHAWIGVRFLEETAVDCLLVAGRYTLLDRAAEEELLPLCVDRGVPVIAASVFNSGVLADSGADPMYWYAPAQAEIVDRVARIREMCSSYDVPLRAAALQFPFRHEAVLGILVGARSPQEMDDNVQMLDLAIPDDLWLELEAMDAP